MPRRKAPGSTDKKLPSSKKSRKNGSDDAVDDFRNNDSDHTHPPVHKRDPTAGSFAVSNLEPNKYQAYGMNEDDVDNLRENFYKDPQNVLAQNVCTRCDPLEACISAQRLLLASHCFTHKVEIEGKPVTNQKNTGRCWSFAALNAIRIPFMKALNLSEFEFSTAHIYFWDKLERSNYFLVNMIKCANEPVDSRKVAMLLSVSSYIDEYSILETMLTPMCREVITALLEPPNDYTVNSDPIPDGGQWDMIVNIIKKYGLMPKKCFPESYSSECSSRMNTILKSKLREFGRDIRAAVAAGKKEAALVRMVKEQRTIIYRILAICLGVPPTSFTWEYTNRFNTYQVVGPITPLEFYHEHVQPIFNLDDKICLVTDPRSSNAYGKLYTVEYLGNMVGGRPCLYNNQPADVLASLAGQSLSRGQAVWFGCEVLKRFSAKHGIQDLEIHDFNVVFGTDVTLPMTKEERLLYHETMLTHAMVFTGVSLDDNSTPIKWRVQNSWGEDRGDKGYLVMTNEWFHEFVFEVVVDRELVPDDILAVNGTKPIVLPPWDPMGVLAQ